MSLNWDTTGCKDSEKVREDGLEWTITECLIWYTMAVDLGEITEKIIEELLYTHDYV